VSDKLRHFPERDPPSRNYSSEKEDARRKLQTDTERFLSAGGVIEVIDYTANRNPQFGLGTMHSVVPGRQISL
jgi:hypothetical protein